MGIAEQFAEMFIADVDNPPDDWFERWPKWPAGFSKPWWPPLSEVWLRQGECPNRSDAAGDHPTSWEEAWAQLQRLHAEWLAAKTAKKDRKR